MNQCVKAFWYSSNNFGDGLSHYLIKNISGKTPILVNALDDCDKVMVTGSILNANVTNATVWGSGLAFSTDVIPPKKKILAVRGKLTADILRRNGVEFDGAIGDPALLLPRLFDIDVRITNHVGIIPHYIDSDIVFDSLEPSDDIKIIDIMDTPENVIKQIKSCNKIISSTLHGIIASHAYGVPCAWAKFSDRIIGDDFKYLDYFSSIGYIQDDFLDFRNEMSTKQIIDSVYDLRKAELSINLEDLLDCCPFKR